MRGQKSWTPSVETKQWSEEALHCSIKGFVTSISWQALNTSLLHRIDAIINVLSLLEFASLALGLKEKV
jgi:hypothetical protein